MSPNFITLPLQGRFIRVNPASIAYLQTDARGMAVVHFMNGSAYTATISPDWIERLVAGEALEDLEKAAKSKAKAPAAKAA
jgi:hypothetical protein